MARLLPVLLALALLAPACADRDGEARAAMSAAAKEVAAGRKLEAESWDAALARYDAGLAAVEKVRKDYADTPAGAMAGKPTTYVGPVTLGVLEGVILPAVRRRAEAEAGPLPCAAFLAEAIAAPLPRARAAAAVARHAYARGDAATGLRMRELAEATAAGLPAGSEAQRAAWGQVAEARLAARELDAARALILAHGLDDAWQRLAMAHVDAGQAKHAAGMVDHALGGAAVPRAEARAAIATALAAEGELALARRLMLEAERLAKEAPAPERARVGMLMARHRARQGDLGRAEAWLAETGGLRDATLAELDDLAAAYRAAGGEARLLKRVHAELALLERGTSLPPAREVPWLANLAYLQARLGEPEPGAFALARARLLADGIAGTAMAGPEHQAAEVDALLRVAERMLAAGLAEPAAAALGDVVERLPSLAPAAQDARLAETARLAAKAGQAERALALVAAIGDPERQAVALAGVAEAGGTGLVVPVKALHDLIGSAGPAGTPP